jgi:glycine betaine/proline transport system ATP-binding protein
MGLSGGKSTLIRCLNRLTNLPLVKFSMIMILLETNKELLETRRTEMSMVFQSLVSSTQNDS